MSSEPGTGRIVFTLCVAGLLSGLAIVLADKVSMPFIEAANAKALQESVLGVLPGATTAVPVEWHDGRLEIVENAEAPALFAGWNAEGQLVGYAVSAEGQGFANKIRMIFGYDSNKKKVLAMKVIAANETPGLGDKIQKDPKFVHEFTDLSVEPKVALIKGKHGTGANEVDGITGATISSRAVVKIVNTALGTHKSNFETAAAPIRPEGK